MKTNAVIRIVLWSIVIVLLAGILLFSLPRNRAETQATVQVIQSSSPSPVDIADIYVVLEPLNVRTMPTEESDAIALLEPGTSVVITRIENVMGKQWGYIADPEPGWVNMEYVQNDAAPTEAAVTLEPPAIEGPGTGYGRYPDGLREISIEWAAGDIYIQAASVDRLEVREVNYNEDKVDQMYVNALDREKLVIRYCEEDSWRLWTGITDTQAKDLYIIVPQDFVLESLEVDAAVSTLTIQNLAIQEVDFDGASGTCDFVNCDFDTLDLDTASGDIRFQGWLNELDCDATSASVYAVFENVPRRIDMDSMSGDLDITLPETAGFTATLDALASDFHCDFSYSQTSKNTYYRGDGACKITMDALSGDVYMRKAAAVSAVVETPTQATTAPAICPEHGADCDDPTHHH